MDKFVSGDLLESAPEIAGFLGISERRVRYLDETNQIPTFRIGIKLCATKTKLGKWIDQLQADALTGEGRATA